MNMIFAELIMAVFGVPVNFTASLQHGWKLGKPFCDVHGFALTLESKSLSFLLIIKNTVMQTVKIDESTEHRCSTMTCAKKISPILYCHQIK